MSYRHTDLKFMNDLLVDKQHPLTVIQIHDEEDWLKQKELVTESIEAFDDTRIMPAVYRNRTPSMLYIPSDQEGGIVLIYLTQDYIGKQRSIDPVLTDIRQQAISFGYKAVVGIQTGEIPNNHLEVTIKEIADVVLKTEDFRDGLPIVIKNRGGLVTLQEGWNHNVVSIAGVDRVLTSIGDALSRIPVVYTLIEHIEAPDITQRPGRRLKVHFPRAQHHEIWQVLTTILTATFKRLKNDHPGNHTQVRLVQEYSTTTQQESEDWITVWCLEFDQVGIYPWYQLLEVMNDITVEVVALHTTITKSINALDSL